MKNRTGFLAATLSDNLVLVSQSEEWDIGGKGRNRVFQGRNWGEE